MLAFFMIGLLLKPVLWSGKTRSCKLNYSVHEEYLNSPDYKSGRAAGTGGGVCKTEKAGVVTTDSRN